jgi:PAX-interacting protein 1
MLPDPNLMADPANQVNAAQMQKSQTKTALANMLSNRLNNGSVNPIHDSPDPNSAAGALRMMGAQHAMQSTPRNQDILALQQQRRTLGNITNSGPPGAMPSPMPAQVPNQIPVPQSPNAMMKGPPFSPGRAVIVRPSFYGHNPNLKLPVNLFLLGCYFFIVEYDELPEKELETWKEVIRQYGGEVESNYSPRVTHVLCKTQRHGITMQSLRDGKRCITCYWLNDIVLKKQLLPPWQALHLPAPSIYSVRKPATKHVMCITGFDGEERTRVKDMVIASGAKFTPYFSRHNTVLICKRIDGSKYKYAKEWNIPTVNAVWLSDILLGNVTVLQQFDSQKYQQYQLPNALRIDYTLVAPLMSKFWIKIRFTSTNN